MQIEIILNRPMRKLGKMGDLVKVNAGYGINFLFPKGYAVPADDNNKKLFHEKKFQLMKDHEKNISYAKRFIKECDKQWFTIVKNSNYDGSLYGSISTNDIYQEIVKIFSDFDKKFIKIYSVMRKIGIYDFSIDVYGEFICNIKINVANSLSEAENAKKLYIENQINNDINKRSAEKKDDTND